MVKRIRHVPIIYAIRVAVNGGWHTVSRGDTPRASHRLTVLGPPALRPGSEGRQGPDAPDDRLGRSSGAVACSETRPTSGFAAFPRSATRILIVPPDHGIADRGRRVRSPGAVARLLDPEAGLSCSGKWRRGSTEHFDERATLHLP